jgi:hypothetical protein
VADREALIYGHDRYRAGELFPVEINPPIQFEQFNQSAPLHIPDVDFPALACL